MYKHASANRFYRLVWSTVNACWVAVAEGTRGRGKSAGRRKAAAVLAGMLAAGSALATAPPDIQTNALPSGAQLVAGQATVSTAGNAMTINQATQQAILNWNSFDIGSKASVRFNQPSASAVALNRVLGNDPSRIYGQLTSNGKVFLINPNGVLFGAGARVNVGGLVASSLGLSDQNFLDGKYDFAAAGSAGAVRNDGTIRSADGGFVALLAPSVTNTGTIAAGKGGVALAAGERVGLDLRGDGLITVQVARGAIAAAVENKGLVQADNGQVIMTASAADALARSSVNNTGLIQARGLNSDGGAVRLVGDEVHVGRVDVASTAGKGGTVDVKGGFVALDGAIKAAGASGGTVTVNAGGVLSVAAPVDARGHAGQGGAVSYTAGGSVTETSSAAADVSGASAGGSVSVQAGADLVSSGNYAARGITGGRIDLSGATVRLMGATLDASGAKQGGLVRVGGAFQGGAQRPDAPDAWRFTGRWGQTPAVVSAEKTFISDNSLIKVGASGAAGQGGTAVVWSNAQTTMLGAIKARGAGAGGVVEVSSKDELRHVGLENIDIGAGGRLLLDPKNILIGSYPTVWTSEAVLGKGYTGGKNLDMAAVEADDALGFAVALNASGDRMAVGAPLDDGVDNLNADAGAVHLFSFSDSSFSSPVLQGTIGAGYTGGKNVDVTLPDFAQFGSSVALNASANVLAVGSVTEGSQGAVRLINFTDANFSGGAVTQTLTPGLNAAMTDANAFGVAVALNGTGDRLAVGSLYDSFGAVANAGAVYLFSGTPGSSTYHSAIRGANPAVDKQFGTSLAFTADAGKLAVGAIGADNFKGAVYLYTNPYTTATLTSTIGNGYSGGKNYNLTLADSELFGSAVSFNATGTRLAVGASSGGAFAEGNGPGNVRIFDFIDTAFSGASLHATLGRDYTINNNADVTLNDFDSFGFSTALDSTGQHLVIGAPFSSSNDGLTTGVGSVQSFSLLPAKATTSLTFGMTKPKPSLTSTIDAATLAATLSTGTSITLQANNDITLESGNNLVVNAPGNGGSLTLQAGRSITLNSSITTDNGNLTLVANETAANGVVNANRDAGSATITLASGQTINAGSGTVDMTISTGLGNTNKASGNLTINGTVNGATINLRNLGPTAASNVVIGAAGDVSGTNVEIAASGTASSVFTNNGNLAATNRYLVYSDAPSTTLEGETGYNKHYNQTYTQGAVPAYVTTGGWFLYRIAPVLTLTAGGKTKVYDGLATSPTLTWTQTGGAFIDADTTAIFSGALAVASPGKNVGTYTIGVGTLAQALGYTVTYNSANFTITRKNLSVSSSGGDKVYNGNLAAPVTLGSVDMVAGDVISYAGSGAFTDKNVGAGKTVNVSGIGISGTDAGNYTLQNTSLSTTASITARTLTASATGISKTYDATTTASVVMGDDRVSGDVLTVDRTGAEFDSKHVGSAKDITVSGLSLSGTDAGNYTLAATTTASSANITPRTLTAGLTGNNRVYDGTMGASVTFSSDALLGDSVTLSGTSLFGDKSAANGKTITTTGITLGGSDGANYQLLSTSGTSTADITRRTLNVTASAADRVYDGGISAAITFGDDKVGGDVLTVSGTGNFSDKHVGTGKTVNVTGIGIAGADAANYTVAGSATSSADITARTLTASATGIDKTYDGTVAATATFGSDQIGGDSITLAGSAEFAHKNAGTGKTVNVTGITLGGADAGNYTLASTTASTSADIGKRTLTADASGVNRTYDGSLAAAVTLSDDRVSGDVLTLSGSGAFLDKNAGSAKTVNVTGIAVGGADADNYTLASSTDSTTADITARTLNASATGVDKTYDGLLGASVTFGSDAVAGDSLTFSGSASFGDKNVGTGKAVGVTGITVGGLDAANYTLASATALTTADITPRALNATVSANNKVYDASAAATATYGDDRVAGDILALSGSASFADKNAGSGKTVTVTGITLTGADAANYTMALNSYSGSADITARALNASATGVGKTYDGTLGATATYGSDKIAGDVLTLSGSAAFADKNVGSGKTVTVTGITLGGADAGNYTLVSTGATTSASITARTLNPNATAAGKVYDGGLTASATLGDDRVTGDALTLAGSASFTDKNVGAGKSVNVTGITLGGLDAGNYTLASTSASTNATITARTLTASATGVNKVYNGNNTASAIFGDNRVNGDALTLSGSASFADKNAGAGKAVTVSGITLSGLDAGNYTLASTSAATTADITARTLNASATGIDKVYDATATASVNLGDDRIAGDSLTLSGNAAYTDKNAGTGKTVDVTGITVGGIDAGNYALAASSVATTASITPRSTTASVLVASKVYDGSTTAAVTYADSGRLAGDILTLSGSANFDTKNVGTGKAVNVTGITLGGADAGNYTLTSGSATSSADITARTLNASAAGVGKTYDGTLAATATYGSDKIAGDLLTLSGNAVFTDKNVGTGKAVTVTGITLGGADAGNYTLASTSAATTADIGARTLNASASAASKVYDGTTTATATLGDDRVAGDVLALGSTGASFATRDAANGKTVTVSGITLGGLDAGNYTLASTSASATANITPRLLTATANVNSKVYDATTAASATFGDDRITGDVLSLSGTAAFANKNVGTGKTVGVTGITLGGADAGNYTLAFSTASGSADITPRTLNASATGAGKTYDGTVAATAAYGSDQIAGDLLTLSGNAVFADKNAGTGKTVTVTGITLGGADAGNYTLASTSAATSADIAARTLTASASAAGKVYDGTTSAVATLGDDRVAGDVLGVSGNASFADKNVGNGKPVTVSGITLGGADAGNYTLASNSASASADITARTLTASATGIGKTYDGTVAASVTYGDDRIAGDVLALSGTASFGDKNAGSGKAVSVTGMTLGGLDAGNYTLASTSATTSADIAKRTLNVNATGIGKTYDGTTNAGATLGDNRIAGDLLALSGTASFGDKNAGIGKAVSVSGITVSGLDAGNYTLASATASTTADIAKRSLTASATGVGKTYDGTTAASATYGDDRVAGDILALSGTASFGDKNAASGKAVSVTGISVSGLDAGNYTLASTTASTSADISQRTLTASATGVNRTYDGTTAATATYADNRVAGDTLNVSGNAAFSDKNAGSGKSVTVTGISLGGLDSGNYALASTSATTTADIAKRVLTANATGVGKTYDGTTAATAIYGDNRVAGDLLTLSGNAAFGDKNAGAGKAVAVTGITLGGTDAGNYTLASTSAVATADIAKRTLNATVTGVNKTYDGTSAAAASYADNRVAGDLLTVAGNATFGDKQAGTGKTVSITGMTLGGADAANYTLGSTTAATTADIAKRTLNASATVAGKTYDGTTAASATFGDNRIAGDILTVSGSASFADKHAGAGKAASVTGITLGGADAGNYTLASTGLTTSADIAKRVLNASATGIGKTYDGTTTASASYGDDRIAGDMLTVDGTAVFGDKHAGSAKAMSVTGITVTGADAANYTLASTSAATSADIAKRSLTVSADDKVRAAGAANPLFTYTANGLVGGDTLALLNGTSGSTDAKAASPAGSYAINLGGAHLNDYQVTYVNGTLTVTAPNNLADTGAAFGSVAAGFDALGAENEESKRKGPFTVVMEGAAQGAQNVGKGAKAGEGEEVIVLRGGTEVVTKRRGLRAPQ